MDARTSSRMTRSTRAICSAAKSAPCRRSSRTRMTPPMVKPRSRHVASSPRASSMSSGTVTPGASAVAEPGTWMNVAVSTSGSERRRGSTDVSGAPSISNTV